MCYEKHNSHGIHWEASFLAILGRDKRRRFSPLFFLSFLSCLIFKERRLGIVVEQCEPVITDFLMVVMIGGEERMID